MDFTSYNKNYITNIVKRNNYILEKTRLNDSFNIFANYLNDLRQAIVETNNLIYQSSGNIDTYFVNVGDGTIAQKNIREIVAGGDGFSLNKILSLAIDSTSIMQVDSNNNVLFLPLVTNSVIKEKDNNLIFDLIKQDNIINNQYQSSIFQDNTITMNVFKDSQKQKFIDNTVFTEKKIAGNFTFEFGANNEAYNFFLRSRKSWDWITPLNNQCEDTKIDKLLHLMITPKAIADNVNLRSFSSPSGEAPTGFMLSPFWSVSVKTKNKKMHYAFSRMSWYTIRPDGVRAYINNNINPNNVTMFYESNKGQTENLLNSFRYTTELLNSIRAKDKKTKSYAIDIEGLEFEDCGTFDDNLFTNDMFVSFTNTYVNRYPSYIGSMYINKKYLNPTFKINKRMCYEAIYADYTKKHGRPALQKENVPDAIVNRLRTHFGVVDSDWDYEGVFN